MTEAPIEVSTNANVSEIDNENFHSEGEMDISQNYSALDNHERSNIYTDLNSVEMVDKDELIEKR